MAKESGSTSKFKELDMSGFFTSGGEVRCDASCWLFFVSFGSC